MRRFFLIAILTACGSILATAESLVLTPGSLAAQLVTLENTKPQELVLTGVVASSDLSMLRNLPSSVTSLDMSLLEIEDNALPPYALFSTAVTSVKLPSTLRSIGEAAFAETPISEIKFPSALSSIGARAFYRCTDVKSVDLSATGVTSIPEQCFYGCTALKTAKFSASVTEIGKSAFMKSGLTEINLPSARVIRDYAFAEIPSLVSVTLSDGVSLGEGAFYGDGMLGNVMGVHSGSGPLVFADSGSRVDAIVVSDETVEEGAYASVKAAGVRFMPGVKEIKNHAFRNMTGLKEVDVSLLGKDVPQCSENAFSGLDVSEISLNVNGDYEEIWGSASVWKDFKINKNISSLRQEAFADTEIYVSHNGDNIIIKSNKIINEVKIWSDSGELLWESEPMTSESLVSLLPDKVLIIRVASEGTVKTIKLIR